MDAEEYWKEHRKNVAGNGDYSHNPKYIEEFIAEKARTSAEWAKAWAILQVGHELHGALTMISGVDDFTGIMRIGAELEAFYDLAKKTLGGGGDAQDE